MPVIPGRVVPTCRIPFVQLFVTFPHVIGTQLVSNHNPIVFFTPTVVLKVRTVDPRDGQRCVRQPNAQRRVFPLVVRDVGQVGHVFHHGPRQDVAVRSLGPKGVVPFRVDVLGPFAHAGYLGVWYNFAQYKGMLWIELVQEHFFQCGNARKHVFVYL